MTKIKNIRISSKQVTLIYLQSISEDDASNTYVDWLNNKQINQYLETRHYQQTRKTVLSFIKKMIKAPNEFLFTIRFKHNNEHIGNIKVGSINTTYNIADVSLFIGNQDAWGHGVATQAIQLISSYSFEQLKLRKLCAGAYKPNIASTKAFIKAGFKQDGILVEHYIFNNKPCDLVQVCLFSKQIDQLPKILIS